MTQPHEKRKFVRIKANHLTRHIKFRLPGLDIFPDIESATKDLSAGGLLFTTAEAYKVGDIIRMELHIPGWQKYRDEFSKSEKNGKLLPVLVLGKVMRVSVLSNGKLDVGIAFVGIDDGQQEALMRYIKEHLT